MFSLPRCSSVVGHRSRGSALGVSQNRVVNYRAEPLLSKLFSFWREQPFPEAVGMVLVGPEGFVEVLRPALGLAVFVVPADSVQEYPCLTLETPKALGDLVQT